VSKITILWTKKSVKAKKKLALMPFENKIFALKSDLGRSALLCFFLKNDFSVLFFFHQAQTIF